jgi:hypothetical protein
VFRKYLYSFYAQQSNIKTPIFVKKNKSSHHVQCLMLCFAFKSIKTLSKNGLKWRKSYKRKEKKNPENINVFILV